MSPVADEFNNAREKKIIIIRCSKRREINGSKVSTVLSIIIIEIVSITANTLSSSNFYYHQ